jgi:MYXO-CTERM domain-containing protein
MVDNFSVTTPAPAGGALLGMVGLMRARRRR